MASKTSFEHNLREQILKTAPRRRKSARILAVLDAKPSKKRTRTIDRMERHARAALEGDANLNGRAIDWSKIDWAKVFDIILKILTALLPLLIL